MQKFLIQYVMRLLCASRGTEPSRRNDVMVVIGGRHSSNTAKFLMCRENCGRTYLIETASELEKSVFKNCGNIGVVAGASTPAGIIKEVN